MIHIGTVVSIYDEFDGKRIKARILPQDNKLSDSELPFAFPLLPKTIHLLPKVGEAVAILFENDDVKNGQRFYIGPIISQPQYMYQDMAFGATALLNGGAKKKDTPVSNEVKTIGAFPKDDEIAICGRKNSDIILSDDDIRIRCGAHLVNELDKEDIIFNKEAPAYIKLKYYNTPLSKSSVNYSNAIDKILDNNVDNILESENSNAHSTATIVADKINLISTNGDPCVNISDVNEGISDEEMIKVINEAHNLPYGDVLVRFLYLLVKMFKSHTHKYDNLPPCPDSESAKFDLAFGLSENEYEKKLLSKNIKIN